MSNIKTSTAIPLIAALPPLSQGVATRSTGWVAAKDYFNYMAVIESGVMGASGTLDAKIEQAQDSGGTGVKDITGKVITQITANNKNAVINFCQNDIDMTNGFTHVRVTLTVAVAASLTSAQLFGDDARFEKATNTIADQTV